VSLRWGVLSTARINRQVIPGLQTAEGSEVMAIASRDRAAATDAAQEYGIPGAHGSYAALLADPEIDAVYIPLPNALHLPWAERALEAGKHVLCEKPLGRRSGEVERAFELAERTDRLLMEGFMYRHHPQTETLLGLVAEGRVGALRTITASFGFNLQGAANIRLDASLDGGALMDVGCYCVHAIRQIAGEPEAVQAVQIVTDDGVDVTIAGALRMPEGILAHFDAGMAQAPRHHLEVVGEMGTLYLADPWHGAHPGIELRQDGTAETIAVPDADPYRMQAEHFARVVAGEEPSRLPARDGVAQARLIEALYAAAGRAG
jgi:D-xylose 1-dehydrogenase (NADP+, D-xylono-1,5-lactone-forming)